MQAGCVGFDEVQATDVAATIEIVVVRCAVHWCRKYPVSDSEHFSFFVVDHKADTSFPTSPSSTTGQYLIMLIAMTFNGYIIIAIILGGIFGHFFSTWDTLGSSHLLDVDELGHGYSSDGGIVATPGEAAGASCCQNNGGATEKDSSSVSSGSDDISHLKKHIVTLPDHGYGAGPCCV